ncbi:MAG: cupin domain-containing protein [Pseudomonadota bacterium]
MRYAQTNRARQGWPFCRSSVFCFGCDLRPFNPLIAALPPILHLPAERASGWAARVIEQAVVESNHPRPGGDAVLERLAEMMFVDAARRYLDNLPEDATVTSARRLNACMRVRIRPGRSTTSPAKSACRVPRCTNASCNTSAIRRCITWPTGASSSAAGYCGNRIAPATGALEVGYESEAAFSRTFKRLVGLPPAAWKKGQARA